MTLPSSQSPPGETRLESHPLGPHHTPETPTRSRRTSASVGMSHAAPWVGTDDRRPPDNRGCAMCVSPAAFLAGTPPSRQTIIM
jgi:hypothetical protein